MTAIFKFAAMTGGSMILYSRGRAEGQSSPFALPIGIPIGFLLRPFIRQKPPAVSTGSPD